MPTPMPTKTQALDALCSSGVLDLHLVDPTHRVFDLGEGGPESPGPDGEKAAGTECFKRIRGEESQCQPCIVDRALCTGNVEEEVVRDPASNRTWQVTAVPLGGNGRPEYVLEVRRPLPPGDEDTPRFSRERWHDIADLLPDMAFEVDGDMNLTWANRAAFRIFGYSPEEIGRGLNILKLVPPEKAEELAQQFKARLEGKVTGPVTYALRKRDGEIIDVEAYSTPVMKEGRPVGLRGIIRDISDRVRVETALRDSEVRYHDLIVNLQVGVFEISIDERRFLTVNPRLARMLGYESSDEVLSLDPEELCPDPARRSKLADLVLSSAHTQQFEVQLKKRDGSELLLAVTSTLRVDPASGIRLLGGIAEDVTARRQLEEALRRSEEKHRSLLNNLNIGVFRTTPDKRGKILAANPRLAEIVGCESVEEILRTDVVDYYVDPVNREELIGRAAKEDGVPNYEVQLRRKDGKPLWATIAVQPVRGPDGRVTHLDGALQDITEHKQAELALRDSEARFRSIFLAAQNVSFIMTDSAEADGRIVEFSPGAKRMFGYSSEEIIGKPVSMLYLPRDKTKLAGPMMAMREKGEFFSGEMSVVRKSGDLFPVLLNIHPVLNAQGKVTKALGISVDITDRKRMEEALRESEENYRTLVDNLSDGLCISRGGRMDYVSDLLAKMLERTPEEILGRSALDLVTPEDHDRLRSRVAGLELGAAPFVSRYRADLPSGKKIHAEVTSRRIHYRGEEALLSLVRDVTDRVTIEQRLRESERLASTGRISIEIAHEVNNPLMAINTSLYLLRNAFPKSSKRQRLVKIMRKEVKRISEIVGQIYDLYGPERQAKTRLDANKVLGEVLRMIKGGMRKRRIRLADKRGKHLPALLLPVGQVKQILYNILLNAIDVSPPGSEIEVLTAEQDQMVRIDVVDHGPGIPSDILPHVFQPYFTTKKDGLGHGLGLGLFVSKSLAENMEGSIKIQSTPSEETCFSVFLPIASAEQSS